MDNYVDLAIVSKNIWVILVTVRPVAVGAHGTVPKGLEKRLREFEM